MYNHAQKRYTKGFFIYSTRKKEDDPWPKEITFSRGSISRPGKLYFEIHSDELQSLHSKIEEYTNLLKKTKLTDYMAVNQLFTKNDLLELLDRNWFFSRNDPELFELIHGLLDGTIQNPKRILELEKHNVISALDIGKYTDVEGLQRNLSILSESSIDLLQYTSNIVKLEQMENEIRERMMEKHDEWDWHEYISNHHLILSQIFVLPIVFFKEEAKIGGGDFEKIGGICDYLYKNKITGNISLIEIKTPNCDLLSNKPYRDGIVTYSISTELSGAIVQVNRYREELMYDYYKKSHNSSETFNLLNPECIVLAGRLEGMEEEKIKSLDLFRNSLYGTTIITYDELLYRIRLIIKFIKSSSGKIGEGNKTIHDFVKSQQ